MKAYLMDLSNSDSDLDDLAFMSSRERPKATPVSSRKSGMGNSRIERALALERIHRQIHKAELNYVSKLIELHECVADGCRRQERIGNKRGWATGKER